MDIVPVSSLGYFTSETAKRICYRESILKAV